MLLSLGNIQIIGEASNGKEAVDLVERTDPDLLFVDVEMPLMSGIEVARRLSGANERIRIIALSAYDYREYVYGLFRSGACAYLKKNEANRENLAAAIVTVLADKSEHWISPDLAKRLVMRHVNRSSVDEPLAGLTQREIELLRAVAYGRSNDDIAENLHLSKHTVKNHIDHVRSKLDVGTRAELVAWAWQNKVVTAG
jgi:DNA-binding NarL/FixJ family response regulator